MPYFMSDKSWYRFDYESGKYVLTDKAPEEAKKSLEELYKELEADPNVHV